MYSVIWSEDAWNDFEKMILNQRQFEEVFKLINDLKVATHLKNLTAHLMGITSIIVALENIAYYTKSPMGSV